MSLQRSILFSFILPATLFLARTARADEGGAPAAMTPAESTLLQRFDTNGDGKLDETELADAHEAMRVPGGVKAARAQTLYARLLRRFDEKKAGKLDPAEQARALQFLKEKRPRVFQGLVRRFDRDGDGQLGPAESADLFAQLSQLKAPVRTPDS